MIFESKKKERGRQTKTGGGGRQGDYQEIF